MKLPFHLIIDYAVRFPEEVERALTEFFAETEPDEKTREQVLPMFNEWLIFEFTPSFSQSFIARYLKENPDNLSIKELGRLNQAAQTQFYGWFEVRAVSRGYFLDLEDLATGKVYRVYDVKGSSTAPEKGTIFARLGKVDNRWWLIGADSAVYPMSYTERFKKNFRKLKDPEKLSVKDIARIWMQPRPEPIPAEKFNADDLKAKRVALRVVYQEQAKRYNVPLAFEALAKAIYGEKKPRPADFWKGLYRYGLSEEFVVNNSPLLQDCWNYLPHEVLGGRSPAEAYVEHYHCLPPL